MLRNLFLTVFPGLRRRAVLRLESEIEKLRQERDGVKPHSRQRGALNRAIRSARTAQLRLDLGRA